MSAEDDSGDDLNERKKQWSSSIEIEGLPTTWQYKITSDPAAHRSVNVQLEVDWPFNEFLCGQQRRIDFQNFPLQLSLLSEDTPLHDDLFLFDQPTDSIGRFFYLPTLETDGSLDDFAYVASLARDEIIYKWKIDQNPLQGFAAVAHLAQDDFNNLWVRRPKFCIRDKWRRRWQCSGHGKAAYLEA